MPLTTRHKRLNPYTILKWARRLVAIAMFVALSLTFSSLGAAIALKLSWAAHIQIAAAALSGAVATLILWALATLIFGRIYCSTVCPLGVVQDIFSRLRRLSRRQRRRHPYRYRDDSPRLRFTILIAVVVAACAGFSLLLALLDPYAAYGRIAAYLLRPLCHPADAIAIAHASLWGLAVAALTLIVVAIVAYRSGRTWCNTVCPVGSALGLISHYSIMHIDINTDRCIQCHRCASACKARCINLNDHTVDTSRCLVCFDCLDQCENGALSYTHRRYRLATPLMIKVSRPQTSASASADTPRPIDRRRFLASGLILAAAPVVLAADRQASALADTAASDDDPTPIYPPGHTSRRAFLTRCVGCGACITACPASILRPASPASGLRSALRPVVSYADSYCRYNCTICSRLCPTGALIPLSREEKHTVVIGHANVDPAKCVGCARCVARCPRHTISMQRQPSGRVAIVNTDGCIGCGACQYICPATPDKAITVSAI